MPNYEVRWYATFYDERNQQLDRTQLGPGKIAIPLDAMYMMVDTDIKESPPVETVHMSPMMGNGGVMPCCCRTPFEVPAYERLTLNPELVTCTRSTLEGR